MSHGKKKYCIVVVVLVMILIIVIAGLLVRGDSSHGFHESIMQIMTQYNEEYEGVVLTEPMEIAVHEIYYGSFSSKDADELLVVCKVLNTPHVAGLDKTLCAVLEAGTLEMVAYEQFTADKVVTACMKNSEGQSRILISAVSGSQGYYSQMLHLFTIEDGQWVSIPQEAPDGFGEEMYYFVGENCLVVTTSAAVLKEEEIVSVLYWDKYTEQFVVDSKGRGIDGAETISFNWQTNEVVHIPDSSEDVFCESMAVGKNGNVFALFCRNLKAGGGYEIVEFANGTLKNVYSGDLLPYDDIYSVMGTGMGEYDVYIKGTKSVYGVKWDKKEIEYLAYLELDEFQYTKSCFRQGKQLFIFGMNERKKDEEILCESKLLLVDLLSGEVVE